MKRFTSPREKRLWMYTMAVVAGIFSTLLLGQPFVHLYNQDVAAGVFLLAMFLITIFVLIDGLRITFVKEQWLVLLGIVIVYLMVFLRLSLRERSHLIEYSVLAIFMYQALLERHQHRKLFINPALLALLLTIVIGVLDEVIQIFLPHRVFDPVDIMFNSMAAVMAIGASLILAFVKKNKWI